MRVISSDRLLDDVTATGSGAKHRLNGIHHTLQAYGTTTSGAGSATIVVEVSDVEAPSVDGDWITIGTISLASLATTRTTDGFASAASWRWVRGRVSAISGTGAKVTLLIGA